MRRTASLIIGLLIYTVAWAEPCTELFFSEYVEGSGHNQALEIINPTNGNVDLSNYQILIYHDGSMAITAAISLSGTLAASETYVVVNHAAADSIKALADKTDTALTFDGNDAIVLYKVSEITPVDAIGVIGDDPGAQGWETDVNNSYTANNTLIRLAHLQQGQPFWSGTDGFFDWDTRDSNFIDSLGSHTMDACCFDRPIASFQATVHHAYATLINQSTTNGVPSLLWTFDEFDDYSGKDTSVYAYGQSGNYEVCLFLTDSCGGGDTACQNITVTCVSPSADFSFTTNDLTATFTNESQVSSQYMSMEWTFEQGETVSDTIAQQTYTFSAPGSYQVCLDIQDSCGTDQICKNVVVDCDLPTVNFSYTTDILTVDFVNASTAPDSITGYAWSFSDGGHDSLEDVQYTFDTSGIYTVCLNVTNGCSTLVLCKDVVLNCDLPTPSFDVTTVGNDSVTLSNTTSEVIGDTALYYIWMVDTLDPDTTDENIGVSFANDGHYPTCLKAVNRCGSTRTCQTVTIGCPAPTADFTASITGLNASFSGTVDSPFDMEWSWDFGDGSTSSGQNPLHEYDQEGAYTVRLIVTDSCGKDTVTKTVNIVCAAAAVDFTFTTLGNTVTLYDQSTPKIPYTTTWDLGNGFQRVGTIVAYTYPQEGTYEVCHTIGDECGEVTVCKQITVSCPLPTVKFTYISPDTSLAVQFLDVSQVTGSYLVNSWDLGHQQPSATGFIVNHTYPIAGTYYVCHDVQDLCGRDTTCALIEVELNKSTSGSGNDSTTQQGGGNNGGNNNGDTSQTTSILDASPLQSLSWRMDPIAEQLLLSNGSPNGLTPQVTLFNQMGIPVYQSRWVTRDVLQIPLSALPSGFYVLHVSTQQHMQAIPLVWHKK